MPDLVVFKSRFWLAHRNGRVAAECDVPMPRGNPYRKGSPSWRAFNVSYAIATEAHRAATTEIGAVHEGAGRRHRPNTVTVAQGEEEI